MSEECRFCYAEGIAHHYGHQVWGPAATTSRRFFGEHHWQEPHRWNRQAERDGHRRSVFCASMADVYEDHPDIAQELREKYDRWFHSITPENQEYTKKPIPIGYKQAPVVELPAIHCKFHGKVRFAGYGFYYDWISHWKRTKDYISWDVEVVQEGDYEIILKYSCNAKNIGSTIRIELDDEVLEKVLDQPFQSEKIMRPDRVIRIEEHERTWGYFKMGTLHAIKGLTELKVKVPYIPKKYAMELSAVIIKKCL